MPFVFCSLFVCFAMNECNFWLSCRTSILCRILFCSSQIVCCPYKYPLCFVLFLLFLPTWQWKSAMFGYLGAQFNFMQNLPSSQLFVVHINILCALYYFFLNLTMHECNLWLFCRAVHFFAESFKSLVCYKYPHPLCFVLFVFVLPWMSVIFDYLVTHFNFMQHII